MIQWKSHVDKNTDMIIKKSENKGLHCLEFIDLHFNPKVLMNKHSKRYLKLHLANIFNKSDTGRARNEMVQQKCKLRCVFSCVCVCPCLETIMSLGDIAETITLRLATIMFTLTVAFALFSSHIAECLVGKIQPKKYKKYINTQRHTHIYKKKHI